MQSRLLKSAVSNFLSVLAIWDSSPWKSGIVRPIVALDVFNSFMLLAESMSLIDTAASDGKAVLEQASLSVFIFQIVNVVEFGHFSNSILSACFILGTQLFC